MEKNRENDWTGWWFQIYFAYESRHQHGAFDMTGGFIYFLFSPLFGEDSHFD